MTRNTALFLVLSAIPLVAAPPEKTPFFRPRERSGIHQSAGYSKQPHASPRAVAVNAASFLTGISPGGLATIFGQDLSDVTGIVEATTEPLPTVLANVEVDVNGIPAPLFTVAYSGGEDQINFQVPYAAPTGPGAAHIQVYNSNDLVADFFTDSFTEDPGIFTYSSNGVNDYAVAFLPDGSLIGPNNAALPGDVLILYTTGLGPLTVDLQDGYGAPISPLAYTEDPFQALVDGEPCSVQFSGLAPGFVALYQINLQLPSDLPAGNLNLQITSQYASSGVVTLPVN
jgi:uncharacterized protein (TIGR03437 family)